MSTPTLLERRAPDARASTWNEADWSFTATLATAAPVVRRDERGEYGEVLSLSQEWPASVPFLDNHRRSSVADKIGVVDTIRVEGGALVGRVVLLRTHPVAAQIAATVAAGQPQAVSIGGVIEHAAERTNPTTKRRELIIDRLALREVSAVLFPADPAATSRGDETMTTNTDPAAAPESTPPAPAASAAVAEVTRAEVNASVREIARSLGLPTTWSDGQIDAGATLEAARSAALDEMVKRSAAGTVPTARVLLDPNDPVIMRGAMAEALAARLAPGKVKPDDRAKQYMGHRLLDLYGELLTARGERINRFDTGALLERAVGSHSGSDLPELLAAASNKILMAAYEAAAPTYRKIAARRSFRDFKEHRFLRIGDVPSFREVTAENGEVQYGTISENRETVKAKEFAMGIVIGRRMLLDDDLSSMSDFSSMIATRAAADENARAYALLASNPDLSDEIDLFDTATHKNKSASGTAIDATNVAAAVAALRKQRSLDGIPLNLAPKYLVVGPDKELQARQLLTAIVATQTSNVNPWSGMMELIVDANISGNAWFIFCEPSIAPVLVYGFVGDAEGPTVISELDFDTRAVKLRAGVDYAIGAIDFRGAYYNAGA